jgi:hypothetical protein
MEPLTQPDYVDGKVIHIGGGEEDIAVQLQENGITYRCTAVSELRQALKPHLNGPTLRAFGTATWMRHADGQWELQAFSIATFVPLDDKPLDQVLK